MTVRETSLDDAVLSALIKLSADWAAEDNCYGYRPNERSDVEGNRVFIAEEDGGIIGYLFGKTYKSENMKSIMPEGTPYFEVEELYVVPEKRSRGVGSALFRFAEDAVRPEAEYVVLSTAPKNREAIFRFYLDELGMELWSARLFRKL